ncbi:hypothetical protein J5N97_004371 [Dioscorea zingiberensis]|uniref:Uncharacterized protein n=1 Tax=Dioscorea zingiberensis TaxID=325984 RepID=A0A9D5D5Z6_9LILI|nr:hypothetical protein J5N97_004371 [Dioscorea zingiberensis]
MGDELNEIRGKAEELKKKLESEEKDKAMLEMEMKRLKVQTEQWRKAAETAAAVLAEDDGVWAMEKQLWIGTPEEEGFKGGRRKSSGGMKVFAELWKKKSGNSNY